MFALKQESGFSDSQRTLLEETIEFQKLDKQCLIILNDHLDEYEKKLRDEQSAETPDPDMELVPHTHQSK